MELASLDLRYQLANDILPLPSPMTIRLLYPVNPLDLAQADEPYQAEYAAALAQGFNPDISPARRNRGHQPARM